MRHLFVIGFLWAAVFGGLWFRKELPDRTLVNAMKIAGTALASVLIVAALVAGFVIIFD